MVPKRYHNNLSDYDNDQEDVNVESVGEILDGFEANAFDSNEENVKILQDRNKTFENTTDIPAEGSTKAKRGPRGGKNAKKCKARNQARYKQKNGIIKFMRGLKVVTADDSLTIFFKHPPVDSSSSIYRVIDVCYNKRTDKKNTRKLHLTEL